MLLKGTIRFQPWCIMPWFRYGNSALVLVYDLTAFGARVPLFFILDIRHLIIMFYFAILSSKQILGRRRGKKKDTQQEGSEVSPTQPDQSSATEANVDQEFERIAEKTDGNDLLSAQDLLPEESLNERTLVDDELSDADLQSFNEGQT